MVQFFSSYEEFWVFYLREHANPYTRALHYAGTASSFALLAAAIALSAWWLLFIPFVGYGFAWIAHFGVERNRPATFRHPIWSLISDYRMFLLWLTGRLGRHLARAGVEPKDRPPHSKP